MSPGIVTSTSVALRLIEQRGNRVEGEVVTEEGLVRATGVMVVVQAGKRRVAKRTLA